MIQKQSDALLIIEMKNKLSLHAFERTTCNQNALSGAQMGGWIKDLNIPLKTPGNQIFNHPLGYNGRQFAKMHKAYDLRPADNKAAGFLPYKPCKKVSWEQRALHQTGVTGNHHTGLDTRKINFQVPNIPSCIVSQFFERQNRLKLVRWLRVNTKPLRSPIFDSYEG